MKITDIKTYLVNANPEDKKVAERPRGTNWLFVKVFTDDGVTGVGEGGGWPKVTSIAIQELKHFVVGEDPFEVERLWMKLHSVLHGHGVTGAVRGGALSAIDMALWDIKGKALHLPVYELLGGKCRDKIRVYGHASTPAKAQQLIEQGYTAFKCPASVEVIRQMRDAVGYTVEIGLHAHAQFTPSLAITVGKRAERYEPAFFEEPVQPENVNALAKVAEALDIPIATGERFFNKWAFTELLDRNIVDILQPEITRLGGILEEKKLAALAEAHYVPLSPHDGSAGPIAEMANIHVVTSIPNFIYLEHPPVADEPPWISTVVRGLIPESNGYIPVPTKPGLGIDLNEEEIAKHPPANVDDFQYRINYRDAFPHFLA
jgi:galactonate dehydratase